jgi:tryptophanyl-tRNA synthetase
MSKSYENCIYITESEETVRKKILQMMTDPQRARRHDPGDPELSPVFAYHKVYSSPDEIAEVAEGCRTAGIGCVDCKKVLIKNVLEKLGPIRGRRLQLEQRLDEVKELIREGTETARGEAVRTMQDVRDAVSLDPLGW